MRNIIMVRRLVLGLAVLCAGFSTAIAQSIASTAIPHQTVAIGAESISIDLDHVSMATALDRIAAAGKVRVSYRMDQVGDARPVTLRRSKISVADALAEVVKGTQLKVVR